MLEAVFISDLHLEEKELRITERFNRFIEWIIANDCRSVYILGDFFHAWAGDEELDNDWHRGIINQLALLAQRGMKTYFMPGNRDFLLGKKFFAQAKLELLPDPAIIQLHDKTLLLSHGDKYCTLDKSHQRFRSLTRNAVFKLLFLQLPYRWRSRLVSTVRKKSQVNRSKTAAEMDVVAQECIKEMQNCQVKHLIHGHTHKPGLTLYEENGQNKLQRFVLSDWDDIPQLLCYDNSKGFKFIHLY